MTQYEQVAQNLKNLREFLSTPHFLDATRLDAKRRFMIYQASKAEGFSAREALEIAIRTTNGN